ncbi:hypothetical protein LTR86_007583 [Recurvomyces mirabilis]|nr:hypothetical protein LTR86_007583 [Recurvomyces mirabilis]
MESTSGLKLDIKIVGAGISGLACAIALRRKGHDITVYERNPELYAYGAGIQLFPNATRVLREWELESELLKIVHQPEVMSIRRYDTGDILGEIALNPAASVEYGHPQWQIYWPDFQQVLVKAATAIGVVIHLGQPVSAVNQEHGTLDLGDGMIEHADIIISGDGIRSRLRSTIANAESQAFQDSVFRAIIPREVMMRDPVTAELMEGTNSMVWTGPGRAVLAYPVSAGSRYNTLLSYTRPSEAEVGRWNQPADAGEAREMLKDFCPTVRKLWSLVDDTAKWKLGDVPKLESYVSESGKFVLIGDAAHAIVPHAGQGAAMAVEDAAALGEFLDPATLTDRDQLRARMHAYSRFRQPRIENIRNMAYGNARFLMMADGAEQQQRDQMMSMMTSKWKAAVQETGLDAFKARVEANSESASINLPDGRMYAYGYDVIGEAKKAMQERMAA